MESRRNLQSLYEICLNAITSTFGIIKKNYLKDLPKHILEAILRQLHPFYLETIENEEFLNLRGVSTDSLWNIHFTNLYKRDGRMSIYTSNSKHFAQTSWRARYFERYFHVLIHEIAVTSDRRDFKAFLNKEFDKSPPETGCVVNFFCSSLGLTVNEVLHLSIKHLTRLRLHNKATCIFLAHQRDILAKLAPFLEHIQLDHLQDGSVEALMKILDVLLAKNKLKSFILSNSKVENVGRFRALLKTLAKSQSLASIDEHSVEFNDQNDDFAIFRGTCGVVFAKENLKGESISLNSGNKQKHESNCNNPQTFDNMDTFASECRNAGKDTTIGSLCDDLHVEKRETTFTSMPNMDSGENLIKLCRDGHVANDSTETEDDLYEDVFSRAAMKDVCLQSYDPNTRRDSNPEVRKLIQTDRDLSVTGKDIRPQCLAELVLSHCFMNNANLKVLSEELLLFSRLRSLTLCQVGLSNFPAITDLITSIKELVIDGSLRHLVFELFTSNVKYLEMFCDMIILSCERCQTARSHKGLWSLRLVCTNFANVDSLGSVLRTCSFCEEPVFAHHADDGIWFKTKDETFQSACKCLNKGVLKSRAGNARPFSEHSDCDLPVSWKQERNEAKSDDSQHFQDHSVQNKPAGRDYIHSRHRYITTGIGSLYMSFDGVSRTKVTVLASSLLRNRSLRSISLPSFNLRTEDISNIFDCISGSDFHECNTTTEKLDLRENLFQVVQNNSLSNLLARSRLVYLDLSYCSLEVIPDDVVLALSSNTFLEVFKIAGNRLGDTGLNQLIKVFTSGKKTSVLNTLDLSCNRLSTQSLLDFGNVLTTWPAKLREIAIADNPHVDFKIAKACLERVFHVILIEPMDFTFAAPMSYVDHLSEM